MTTATKNIIRSACVMDATVDADAVNRAIAILDGDAGKPQPDEPLTPKEVAAMLKCCARTVQRYGDTGKLRRIGSRKQGTATRYSRKSVVAFLNGEVAA